MADGYSFKTQSMRPVRGPMELVDKTYPALDYEFLKLGVRADMPTIEARSGSGVYALAVQAAPTVHGNLSIVDPTDVSKFSVDSTSGNVLIGGDLAVGTSLGITGLSTLNGLTHAAHKISAVPKTTANFAANVCDLSADTSSGWLAFTCGAGAGISAASSITMPTAAANSGRVLLISITNSSGSAITCTGTKKMGLVDDLTAFSVADAKFNVSQFFCDGSNWYYVASF